MDLMFLGLGMNGHLGLNEPGVDVNLYSHVVDLHPVTARVVQKYFREEIKLEKGITLGLRQIMAAKMVILAVSGGQKAEIVRKVVHGEIINAVPGSFLQRHENCHLFLDREAAKLLNQPDITG